MCFGTPYTVPPGRHEYYPDRAIVAGGLEDVQGPGKIGFDVVQRIFV